MRFYLLFISLFFVSLFSDKAIAHIDHGGMPDSVAEMEYRILLEFEPQKHDIRNKLGDVLFRLKKYKEAQTEFQAVLAAEPKNLQAQMGIGQLLIHDQKWQEAEKLFEVLQDLHPESIEISYFLGIIYTETSRLDKAEKILKEALKRAEADESEELNHVKGKINEALVNLKVQGEEPVSKISQ